MYNNNRSLLGLFCEILFIFLPVCACNITIETNMDPEEIVADSEQALREEERERSTNKRCHSDDELETNSSDRNEKTIEPQAKRSRGLLQTANVTNHLFGKQGDRKPLNSESTGRPRNNDQTKPEFLNRNRRLFGSLVGHLGQAKQSLEKESEKISKQKQLQVAASERRLQDITKKQVQQERSRKLMDLKSQLSSKKRKFEAWKLNFLPLKNFLVTSVEPKLFWLPKHHNETTSTLLEKRYEDVQNIISQRQAELDSFVHKTELEIRTLETDNTVGNNIDAKEGQVDISLELN